MYELGISCSRASEKDLGLAVQNLTPEIAQTLGLKRAQAVGITVVEGGSPADRLCRYVSRRYCATTM